MIISCSRTTDLGAVQEVMHHPTWLSRRCPAATAPPTDSELAVRAGAEPGSGAGAWVAPRGHGWARKERGLVTDGRRGSLKCPD